MPVVRDKNPEEYQGNAADKIGRDNFGTHLRGDRRYGRRRRPLGTEDRHTRILNRNVENTNPGGVFTEDGEVKIEHYAILMVFTLKTSRLYYIFNDCFHDFTNSGGYYHPRLINDRTNLAVSVTRRTWPSPFRATLVVPIRGDFTDEVDQWCGFLCLDARKKGRFDRMYAPMLACTYADSFYTLYMAPRPELQKKAREAIEAAPPRQLV